MTGDLHRSSQIFQIQPFNRAFYPVGTSWRFLPVADWVDFRAGLQSGVLRLQRRLRIVSRAGDWFERISLRFSVAFRQRQPERRERPVRLATATIILIRLRTLRSGVRQHFSSYAVVMFIRRTRIRVVDCRIGSHYLQTSATPRAGIRKCEHAALALPSHRRERR